MEERHTHEERDEARRQNRERRLRRHKLWRAVRPALVGLVSIGICIGVLGAASSWRWRNSYTRWM